MKKKLKLYSVLSLLSGGLLLISFFIDLPAVTRVRSGILSGAECLFMLILFLSLLDTIFVHVREIGSEGSVRVIHVVSFAVFLAVLILGLLKGSTHTGYERLIYILQQVVESASSGLICIGLIYALYRLPRQHISPLKSGFVIGLVFYLFIYSGLDRRVPASAPLNNIIKVFKCIPPSCLEGLFLGLSLGAAVAGLRRIFTGGHKSGEQR